MRELSAAKLLTEGVHPMEERSMTKAEMRCAWLTDKYILCLLALFPLFTGFHGYANLTAAKFWLYTGATALWALGIAACLCTGARLFAKKPGAFFYLTCAFLVWNLVSAALSPWREKTFLGAGRYDGLFTQFLYALTALGIARWDGKRSSMSVCSEQAYFSAAPWRFGRSRAGTRSGCTRTAGALPTRERSIPACISARWAIP